MKGYIRPRKGVFVHEGSLNLLKRTDSLVLDIDGVIVDVTSSFRMAISQTTQYFLTEILDFSGEGLLLTPQETQFFKLAGGFNNDWELTYAACLFFLRKSVKQSTKDIARVKQSHPTLEEFTSEVRTQGGGIEAAQKVVLAGLGEQQKEQVEKDWNQDLIRQIFQEIYGGTDYCQRLYGFSPSYVKRKGLINEEEVILNSDYLELFLPNVAILTGRTREEAEVALGEAGLNGLISGHLILSDEGGLKKPDPGTLLALGERMNTVVGLYVGDVVDDFETVNNFKNLDTGMRFVSGIVCQEPELELYKSKRVDIIAYKANDLLAAISDLKGEKYGRQAHK